MAIAYFVYFILFSLLSKKKKSIDKAIFKIYSRIVLIFAVHKSGLATLAGTHKGLFSFLALSSIYMYLYVLFCNYIY